MANYSRLQSEFQFIPVGSFTRNASISAATSLTIPARATGILLQADTATVYYTLDGTTPTTTAGFILQANELVRIDLFKGGIVKVISATGAVRYQFFGANV